MGGEREESSKARERGTYIFLGENNGSNYATAGGHR